MTARQHRGGLARADITNGERRYLKDRNHSAFEVFKCKQSLFNQLNQHQAPSTYKVYCKLLSAKKKMPSNLLLSADSLICDRSVVCTRICKFATKTLFCKCAMTCYFPKQLLLKYFSSDLGCMLFNVSGNFLSFRFE